MSAAAGRGLLVGGTTSDAGKTVLVTGLCRAFARRGLRVAPFKAQNMSNTTVVVAEPGGALTEIGRAQQVQARAAGARAESAMNPVLLQPAGDRTSHVLVRGRPAGRLGAGEFATGRAHLAAAAFEALDDLRSRYDLVVCEGAGSIAEINLRARDYVNLGLARHGDLPTVVVGDIDRGGVFAALLGALAVLEPADQALVAGFVVNNFRGDPALLRPGLDDLAARTGRPVFGVLPHAEGLWLDAEDSLSALRAPTDDDTGADGEPLTVAAVALPRAAQVTDLDALAAEPRVRLRPVSSPRGLSGADAVIVPGSRAVVSDLDWLRARGLGAALTDFAARGGTVLGLGGGHQMLGTRIRDTSGVEAPAGTDVPGLGLVDAITEYGTERILELAGSDGPHGAFRAGHGVTTGPETDWSAQITGTALHETLTDTRIRARWLRAVAARAGVDPAGLGETDVAAEREARIDRIADLVETHLDLDRIIDLTANPPRPPTLRVTKEEADHR